MTQYFYPPFTPRPNEFSGMLELCAAEYFKGCSAAWARAYGVALGSTISPTPTPSGWHCGGFIPAPWIDPVARWGKIPTVDARIASAMPAVGSFWKYKNTGKYHTVVTQNPHGLYPNRNVVLQRESDNTTWTMPWLSARDWRKKFEPAKTLLELSPPFGSRWEYRKGRFFTIVGQRIFSSSASSRFPTAYLELTILHDGAKVPVKHLYTRETLPGVFGETYKPYVTPEKPLLNLAPKIGSQWVLKNSRCMPQPFEIVGLKYRTGSPLLNHYCLTDGMKTIDFQFPPSPETVEVTSRRISTTGAFLPAPDTPVTVAYTREELDVGFYARYESYKKQDVYETMADRIFGVPFSSARESIEGIKKLFDAPHPNTPVVGTIWRSKRSGNFYRVMAVSPGSGNVRLGKEETGVTFWYDRSRLDNWHNAFVLVSPRKMQMPDWHPYGDGPMKTPEAQSPISKLVKGVTAGRDYCAQVSREMRDLLLRGSKSERVLESAIIHETHGDRLTVLLEEYAKGCNK